MDILTVIVALATAILSLYIGYVLGNFFPMIKRDKQTGDRASGDRIMDYMKSLLESFSSSSDEDQPAPQLVEAPTAGPALQEPIENQDRDSFLESLAMDLDPDETPKAAPAADPPPQPLSKGHPFGTSVSDDDVLTLWHDRKSRELVAEMKGRQYSIGGTINPDHHSRLSLLLIDLQDKVGLSAGLKSALSDEFDKAVEEDEKMRKPSFNPFQAVVDYVQADVPQLDEESGSIPAQINKILKEQIKGSPLEKMGIHLSEMGDKGVVFMVGLDIYHEIHQIPESEVRLAIRKAVKTWEDKNLSGS